MIITQNIRADRVTGTLELKLRDGRTAELEVDIDLTDDETAYGVDYEYHDEHHDFLRVQRVPVSQTFSLRLPWPKQEEPQFTLRIPVDDS